MIAIVPPLGNPGALSFSTVLVGAVLVAFLCGGVLLGTMLRGTKRRDRNLRSALAAECRYAEEVTTLVSRLVPALSAMDLDGVLRWTAETARGLLGAQYAHVVVLDGLHHRTAAGESLDAYPSCWHPAVQGLIMQSRREDGVVRCDEPVHGIEGFVAAPLAAPDGERLGAIVVGGKALRPSEERVLRLLADQACRALRSALAAPGGRDPASGLPNRASLRRFLRGEFSRGGSPAVLVLGLRGFPRREGAEGNAAEAEFLRALARKLEGNRRRVFRYGEDELAVALKGSDGTKAHGAALRARRVAAELAEDAGVALTASVGFAAAGGVGCGYPEEVLGAALGALRRAAGRPEGVAGPPAEAELLAPGSPGDPEGGVRLGEAVLALAAAVEAREPRLGEHSRAVARTARRVGSMMGLAPGQMDTLAAGALLHDVGKVGIPDAILHKPGPLDKEEYAALKRHPELGVEIAGSVEGLAAALPAVRHHHERWDGRGYPDGLRGEDIPLLARIVFVADALDAMTRDRSYRRGIPEREALEEIRRNSGTQFDPAVVGALTEVLGEPDVRRTGSAG